MDTFAEILKITLPALLVLITAYLVIYNMLKDERERRHQEITMQTVKVITPVKLQAYERAVLFLERIKPESLLLRVGNSDLSARQLHSILLSTIRSEFEHNLSQQIYMSNEAWEMVKNARNTIVRIINNIANELPPAATGEELSRTLIEEMMELENDPLRLSIDFIKAEFARIA